MGSLVNGGEDSKELVHVQAHLWNTIFGFVNSMSLKCTLELGIFDAVHAHGKPITLSELASAIAVPPARSDSLWRLVRLLVQLELLAIHRGGGSGDQDAYVLTRFSAHLVKGNTTNLSPFVFMMTNKTLNDPWHGLSEWFKGGEAETSFELAYGTNVWEMAKKKPELSLLINEAMAAEARFTTDLIMRECGDFFGGLKTLVDVGGGTGTVAKAIVAAHPHVKVTVFDLPHVVASLPKNAGIGAIGGDMFERVPLANALLLKKVLHDWSDEESVKILKKCKEAIPSKEEGGMVILIEMVVGRDGGDPELARAQLGNDVLMMAQTTGKEREEHEWKKIFEDAGFSSYEIKKALGLQSLIVVYP